MDMSQESKWYKIVSGRDLAQGDFLDNFPLVLQAADIPVEIEEIQAGNIEVKVDIANVIVMTQSCDFQKLDNDDVVNLCPRFDFRDHYGSKNKWKSLVKGKIINEHLLDCGEVAGREFDYQVVDLSRVFSVPYGYVRKFADAQGERIRLLPPYREHLSQAFAKRFMRVGLPYDLPRDYPYDE